jgi:hypothetical protein
LQVTVLTTGRDFEALSHILSIILTEAGDAAQSGGQGAKERAAHEQWRVAELLAETAAGMVCCARITERREREGEF